MDLKNSVTDFWSRLFALESTIVSTIIINYYIKHTQRVTYQTFSFPSEGFIFILSLSHVLLVNIDDQLKQILRLEWQILG